jgi:hypothetical protein
MTDWLGSEQMFVTSIQLFDTKKGLISKQRIWTFWDGALPSYLTVDHIFNAFADIMIGLPSNSGKEWFHCEAYTELAAAR